VNPQDPIVIYEHDTARVEVRLGKDTVWLRQEQMAELFGRERSVITKHIRNVFAEGELERDAVCANFAHTAADGKTYQVEHYNLDVIISVGYRVKSLQGTRFRQWATRVLREHLTQGFSLDRQRFTQNVADLEAALQLVRKAAAELWPPWQFPGRGYRIGSKSRNTAQPYDTRLPKPSSATLQIKGARRILARTELGTATQRREQ
jgi:hypothetical protein